MHGVTEGSGTASHFEVRNPSNTVSAIYATTNGSGATLYVNHGGNDGTLAIFANNNSHVARIDKTGKGFFNGGTQQGGAAIAEAFDVIGSVSEYEPGDVLVVSTERDRTVEKSSTPNSAKVVGVYATKPGVLLTEKGLDDDMSNMVPMGVVGVIPTKVTMENGPIKRGDLLVTSSTRGHAMKAVPVNIGGVDIYPQGAIIGKALENFDGLGHGIIQVMVNVK
jgi:trimeric autotransporter adhesin